MIGMLWRGGRRFVYFMIVVVLGYLCQVCVMPYLAVNGVTASMLFAVTAIVTVCYGKLRAFWVGAWYGIVMEIMLPSITFFNLLLYPVAAIFSSLPFADKSDKRLEYERSVNKQAKNMNPYLRTVLCAGLNTFIYELINLVYVSLGGTALTTDHLGRAVLDLLLTMALAAVLMLPVRRFLGFGRKKKAVAQPVA